LFDGIRGSSRDASGMGLRKVAILEHKQFIKGTAVKDADRCEKRKMGAAIFFEEARNWAEHSPEEYLFM